MRAPPPPIQAHSGRVTPSSPHAATRQEKETRKKGVKRTCGIRRSTTSAARAGCRARPHAEMSMLKVQELGEAPAASMRRYVAKAASGWHALACVVGEAGGIGSVRCGCTVGRDLAKAASGWYALACPK